MHSDLLAPLSDKALGWLADLAFRRGPKSLHERAPRIIDWLRDAACASQALRRGEAAQPVEPPTLLLRDEELEASATALSLFGIAIRNLGVEREATLDPTDAEALLEVLAVVEQVASACRTALGGRTAEGSAVTYH